MELLFFLINLNMTYKSLKKIKTQILDVDNNKNDLAHDDLSAFSPRHSLPRLCEHRRSPSAGVIDRRGGGVALPIPLPVSGRGVAQLCVLRYESNICTCPAHVAVAVGPLWHCRSEESISP
jgi:hypothetical protein